MILKKTKCEAVKMEYNKKNYNIIKSVVSIGIPVMGHIGFTPQHFKKFKVQGLIEKEQNDLIEQANKNQDAGVFSLVLECIGESTAKAITKSLKIPTIGIGASKYCDGQILVSEDMLGFFSEYYPKFVKRYGNLSKSIKKSIEKYSLEVQNGKFPSKKFEYN